MRKQNLKIVDESNPIPKYLQISAWLKELIQTGRYQADEKLLSRLLAGKVIKENEDKP